MSKFTLASWSIGCLLSAVAACSTASSGEAGSGAAGASGAAGNNNAGGSGGEGLAAGGSGEGLAAGGSVAARLPSCDGQHSGADMVFASSQTPPGRIAVDDTGIYVATAASGGLLAIPPGGGSSQLLYENVNTQRLALGAGVAYVVTGASNGCLGCADAIVAITPGGVAAQVGNLRFVGELATDSVGGDVYVGGSAEYHGIVWSASGAGAVGPLLTTTATATGSSGILDLRVFGNEVFVRTEASHSQIERGATTGGNTTVVVSVDHEITALAVDQPFVYWAEGGASPSIKRAAHDGSSSTTVAPIAATSLASDGTSLFATTGDAIIQISLSNFSQTVLAPAQAQPHYLVEHGNRTYWINQDAMGAAMSACKIDPTLLCRGLGATVTSGAADTIVHAPKGPCAARAGRIGGWRRRHRGPSVRKRLCAALPPCRLRAQVKAPASTRC